VDLSQLKSGACFIYERQGERSFCQIVGHNADRVEVYDMYRDTIDKCKVTNARDLVAQPPPTQILVLGSNMAGKTTMLASLRHWLFKCADIQVRNPISQYRYWEEMERRVFDDCMTAPFTGEHVEGFEIAKTIEDSRTLKPPPLHLEAGFGMEPDEVSLLFNDIGGEQFAEDTHPRFRSMAKRADGFALLVDPLMSRQFAQSFEYTGEPYYAEPTIRTADAILQNLINVTKRDTQKIKTPLAVLLTKCDLGSLEAGACLQMPKQGVGPDYVRSAREEISGVVERCLNEQLEFKNLTGLVDRHFETSAYFAVSATGVGTRDATDEEREQLDIFEDDKFWDGEPQPQRVGDFLLWLHHEALAKPAPRKRWSLFR